MTKKKPGLVLGLTKEKNPCSDCKTPTRVVDTFNGGSICIDCYFGVKK